MKERAGEIFRFSALSLRKNLKYILLLVLLVSLPIALLRVYLVDARFDSGHVMNVLNKAAESYASGDETALNGIAQDAYSKMLLYMGLTLFLSSFSLLLHAGVILLSRAFHRREETDFRTVFDGALRIFPKLWLTQLLADVMTALGLMLCFLPGIFLYFVFFMTPYAVVLTGLWGRKGLFVSSLYTRKYRLPVLLCLLASLAFTFVTGLAADLVLLLLPDGTVYEIGSVFALCLLDFLSCIPVVFITGYAENMELNVDFSRLRKQDGTES